MAVQFRDYYETLGIPRDASAEDIKKAFRRLARLHHPDVAKNKAASEEKFKEINEAYEVLGDPEKRRRYDELGADWQQQGAAPPPPGGVPWSRGTAGAGPADFEFDGTGFSDFFESFFGGGREGFGSSRSRGGRRASPEEDFSQAGSDVEADLLVPLEEVLTGGRRKVTLRRSERGGRARTDTYQVRIPAGVHEGQRIRLAGQGEAGAGGGAPGDLYLRVRLARHPDFNVEGSDLHCDLDLAPWEAVLGVKVTIPALEGRAALTVPPGTAADSRLRLRGLGLPREDGGRGDLYATIRIQVPASAGPEERALWQQLARASQFNPRA